jgi:hypothetical protein
LEPAHRLKCSNGQTVLFARNLFPVDKVTEAVDQNEDVLFMNMMYSMMKLGRWCVGIVFGGFESGQCLKPLSF